MLDSERYGQRCGHSGLENRRWRGGAYRPVGSLSDALETLYVDSGAGQKTEQNDPAAGAAAAAPAALPLSIRFS